MTPGTYLRKRREAAGLTIDDVAAFLEDRYPRANPALRVRAFEESRDCASSATIDALRAAFSFDPDVYASLVAGVPAGQLCRDCACSWNDACRAPAGNCHWVETDLCSACAAAPIADDRAPSFIISADDPFAVPIVAILGALRLGGWTSAETTLRETIARERNTFRSTAIGETAGDEIMRAADAMAEWRDRHPATLPQGENVHV